MDDDKNAAGPTETERMQLMLYRARLEAHAANIENMLHRGAQLEAEYKAFAAGLEAKYGRAE